MYFGVQDLIKNMKNERLIVTFVKINYKKKIRRFLPFTKTFKHINRIFTRMEITSRSKFKDLSKEKSYKLVIENLWNFCYERIKKIIWINRCNEAIEIEKKKGIEAKDKKRRKVIDEEGKEDNVKDKNKKIRKKDENNINEKNLAKTINLVTKDKMIQKVTEERSIENTWGTVIKLK
jgi:hypothetical protein